MKKFRKGIFKVFFLNKFSGIRRRTNLPVSNQNAHKTLLYIEFHIHFFGKGHSKRGIINNTGTFWRELRVKLPQGRSQKSFLKRGPNFFCSVLKLCAVRVTQVCREIFLKLKFTLIFHKMFSGFPL